MREDGTSETTGEEPVPPARSRGVLLLTLVLLLSLGGGTALGLALIGPRLLSGETIASHAPDEAAHGKSTAPANLHTIESLVVNPAGSAGTRFLIATIVVEVDDPKSAEALKARDAAVRDVLLHLLGGKTVEELSDVGRREALKAELAAGIGGLSGTRVRRIFLPQYVLQ